MKVDVNVILEHCFATGQAEFVSTSGFVFFDEKNVFFQKCKMHEPMMTFSVQLEPIPFQYNSQITWY